MAILTIIPAIILGCFVGFSIGYLITACSITKSNDYGNAKGNFDDFTRYPLHVNQRRDKIPKPKL